MGRPIQQKFINRTDVAATAITTTQPSPTLVNTGWPIGDNLLTELNLRLSGTLSLTASSAGTIISGGGHRFLRSLTLSTDKHNNIIDGLDGYSLDVLNRVYNRTAGIATDITDAATGTPSYEYHLKLPMIDKRAVRPFDTAVDLGLVSSLQLKTQYGVVTDFISGGTYSVESVNAFRQECRASIYPGPVDRSKDAPLLMPYWGMVQFSVSATATNQQFQLSYGDRIIKKLFVTQRNSSTLARLANSIIGANDADRISVDVNGFRWFDSVQWLELQDSNAETYGLSAMPTGTAVIDFEEPLAGGVKHSDALDLLKPNGTINLYADVTTGTNYQLWVIYEALKVIPPGAMVPVPQAPAPNPGAK